MLRGVTNPRGQPHGGASGAPAAACLLQPAPRSGWWKASSTPGSFSASRATPALTHSLAASSGISGKGSSSGDFCCFSWDQRSIPTLSRGGRPRRGTAMGMVTPRALTGCDLPKKQLQEAAGLVSTGPWLHGRLPAWCGLDPGKPGWLVSSRTSPRPASPLWTFPALWTCRIPESRWLGQGAAVHVRPSSALKLSTVHL